MDHSETVRVEFDPQVVSYDELLEVFWDSHVATTNVPGRQYRNALFYTSDEQRLAAETDSQRIEQLKNSPVYTAIEPAGQFYPAEDYHQKFYLRRNEKLFSELRHSYHDEKKLIASTTAARLNGYLSCNGNAEQLAAEIGMLGLSPTGQRYLLDYVKNACQGFGAVKCVLPPLE